MSNEPVMMLGSCVRIVLDTLISPTAILGDFDRYEECQRVDPARFYPLDLYVDLVEHIGRKLPRPLVVKLGRAVARQVIDDSLSKMKLRSAVDAIGAIQAAHEYFCRPVVGEFRVAAQDPGGIDVVYTAPYDCVLQEGLFMEIASAYGNALAAVEHAQCRRSGAPACRFRLKWKGARGAA